MQKRNSIFQQHDHPVYWITTIEGRSSSDKTYDTLAEAERVYDSFEDTTNMFNPEGEMKYLMVEDPDGSMYHIRKARIVLTPEQRERLSKPHVFERKATPEEIAKYEAAMADVRRREEAELRKAGPYENTYYFQIDGHRYPGLYADRHSTYELFIPTMQKQFQNVCTPREPLPTIFELAVRQYNEK